MKTLFRTVLIAIGAIYILDALFMSAVANLNTGNLLALLLGAVLLIYGIFFNWINRHTGRGFLRILRYLAYAGLCFIVGLTAFLSIYGQMDNATYQEDAVIVLGAGLSGDRVSLPLAYRLDKAAEYAALNPDAVIVVSGGQGFQETIPEAEAMEAYLLRSGVPAERIIKEDQSHSTYENFQFSKALLDQHFDGAYTTAVITNNFHIFRASQLARDAGFHATHLHAPIQWYTLPVNYLRECAAVMKYWIFRT